MKVTALAQALAAVTRCKGNIHGAYHMAHSRWGEGADATMILRTAITTGVIGDATAFGDLIAGVPSRSIINAIAAVSPWRRAAPGVPVLCETEPPAASWRNEAQPIAVTSTSFETVRLRGSTSVGGILIYTVEAGRELGDTFMRQLGNDAGEAINYAESSALFDPANDGSGTAPTSLTHDAVTVQSSGTSADAIRNDLASLLSQFRGDLARSCWACSTRTAVRLAFYGDALGSADVTIQGGALGGLPLCAARGVPDSILALTDTSGVVMFDGGAEFSASEQATLTMPDGSNVDLWAANMGALRFTRVLDWAIGRPGCVAAVVNIDWQGTA
ncbi:hypothetical protein BH160DRAFT_0387 [Burkholderia sp. H160]|nr:hypothetical protein BH160DRAFT_0387 [Burkholderia sp. H160]